MWGVVSIRYMHVAIIVGISLQKVVWAIRKMSVYAWYHIQCLGEYTCHRNSLCLIAVRPVSVDVFCWYGKGHRVQSVGVLYPLENCQIDVLWGMLEYGLSQWIARSSIKNTI